MRSSPSCPSTTSRRRPPSRSRHAMARWRSAWKTTRAGRGRARLALTVDVEPVGHGTVRVNEGGGFAALTEAREVRVGSTIDTTGGEARVTAAVVNPVEVALPKSPLKVIQGGLYQSGQFSLGAFEVLQRPSQHGLVHLRMLDAPSQVCAAAARARARASKLS